MKMIQEGNDVDESNDSAILAFDKQKVAMLQKTLGQTQVFHKMLFQLLEKKGADVSKDAYALASHAPKQHHAAPSVGFADGESGKRPRQSQANASANANANANANAILVPAWALVLLCFVPLYTATEYR